MRRDFAFLGGRILGEGRCLPPALAGGVRNKVEREPTSVGFPGWAGGFNPCALIATARKAR